MNINTLAKLTWFGLAYIYTARLIDTLHHGIFKSPTAAGTVVGLNLLAGLVQLVFFIALLKQLVPKEKPALRTAAWLAIMGSIVALLPKFLSMAVLFQPRPFFFFLRHGRQIRAFCPWLTAALLFTFCLTFFLDHEFGREKRLKGAFGAGAAGWLIMVAAQSLVVINYLTAGQPSWLVELFLTGPMVFVTASSLTFVCLSVFYLTFAHR